MTPKRKAALQWFHDKGEVQALWAHPDHPSRRLVYRMIDDGQLRWAAQRGHFLTDKGRRMLHGDKA
jgi:hypothetical protein